MDFLPTTLGTRPRLAVELRPEGVVAARAEDAQALLSAVAYGVLAEGTVVPGLKLGNIAVRAAALAAVRKVLEAVALRDRRVTMILPDGAVRVLLLDFDQLPAKAAEALPVVRFRLKKLLPFDAEEAVVSYQVMSTSRGLVQVLAVAIPKDVLGEYESLVREAGFEPGAVLPSTLAACAGLALTDTAELLVNAGETSVTTAIVKGGVLLLHRTVDLAAEGLQEAVEEPTAPTGSMLEIPVELLAGFQERDPLSSTGSDGFTKERSQTETRGGYEAQHADRGGTAATFGASRHAGEFAAEARDGDARSPRAEMLPQLPTWSETEQRRLTAAAREVTQAVSVAAAYFEDTLAAAPGLVLSAGTMGAEALGTLLREAGFSREEMHVKELLEPVMLTGGAVSARVPHGWMAGVRGALRS